MAKGSPTKRYRFLFDVAHPAHVHFFRHAILGLQQQGHQVRVASRDKDLTLELLRGFGIPNKCLSRVGKGVVGLGMEMVVHQFRLALVLLRFRPHVVATLGGPLATHASRFFAPVLLFTDTEIAKLGNRITFPFATAIVVPDCFQGPYYGCERKVIRYPGYHELSYLHPTVFTPEPNFRERLGVGPSERIIVVRFIAWGSAHDLGLSGLSLEDKRVLVGRLTKLGRVYITSEAPLPADLVQYRYPLHPTTIHNLLACSSLFIGESATMASETVVLGKPAIFISPTRRGYTDEQEQRYGMCYTYPPGRAAEATEHAVRLLSNPATPELWAARRERLLARMRPVSQVVMGLLLAYAQGQRPHRRESQPSANPTTSRSA